MMYLEMLREKEGVEMENFLNKKDKKDFLDELHKNKILSKKISFSDFSSKFKVNPYLFQFFDYYDIQKINQKEVKRALNEEEKKNMNIKPENELYIDSEEDKNINMKTIKTENNFDINKYENYINKNYTINKSHRKLHKKYKKLNLSGVDFNLINKITAETLKVKKEIDHLNYLKELNKEKEKIAKKMSKVHNSDEDNKNININNLDNLVDEYTIFHKSESKNIKKLKKLRSSLAQKIDKEMPQKRKLSKTIYQNSKTYFIYIPNSAKYKHISYHKDCLFKKDFKYDKKVRMALNKNKNKTDDNINKIEHINKINNLIKTQKNYFTNPNAYFLTTNDNLLTKSNYIIGHLKEIKSVLKQDRNYTSRTISRASNNFFRSKRRRQDQKLMEKMMNENKQSISEIREIHNKRKNKKFNEKNDVFKILKELNGGFERDKKYYPNIHIQFSKSLNHLCKEERKENKEYSDILKNNYRLRLQDDDVKEIKNIKKNMEQKQILVNVLNYKIHKKCDKIIDIIEGSCKNKE